MEYTKVSVRIEVEIVVLLNNIWEKKDTNSKHFNSDHLQN